MGEGAIRGEPTWRSPTRASGALMAHLRVVVGSVELSKHDPAEGRQRSLTLLVGQQTPELIERQRPNDSRARGGATSDPLLDMGLLLLLFDSLYEPIPPAATGRPARLWVCPGIPVKGR